MRRRVASAPTLAVFDSGRLALGYFALATQTSGAKVKPLRLTVYGNGGGMNIGHPAPIGMVLGVAHIMAKLG